MNQVLPVLIWIIIGIVIGYIYELLMFRVGKFTNRSKIVIFRYKLHHSLYGLALILFGLIIHLSYTIFLIALGVGIIIQHSISGDGFVFITKEITKGT